MRLREYLATNMEADHLVYKDVFRQATRRGLMSFESCERWFEYRDKRNSTSHDYGEGFAETTLTLLPVFIEEARHQATIIQRCNHEGTDV